MTNNFVFIFTVVFTTLNCFLPAGQEPLFFLLYAVRKCTLFVGKLGDFQSFLRNCKVDCELKYFQLALFKLDNC